MGENFVCYLLIYCTQTHKNTIWLLLSPPIGCYFGDIIVIVNRRRDTRHDNDDENRIFYGCWMLSTRMNRESLFQKRERRWTQTISLIPDRITDKLRTRRRQEGEAGLAYNQLPENKIYKDAFPYSFYFSYFSFLLYIIFSYCFHKDIFKSYLLLHYKNKLLLCG